MNKQDLQEILDFAKENNLMDKPFEYVLNKYLNTNNIAYSYENI